MPIIGEIELTQEEECIMRKNPKAYSLMRMELRDEEEVIQEEKRARIEPEDEEENRR